MDFDKVARQIVENYYRDSAQIEQIAAALRAAYVAGQAAQRERLEKADALMDAVVIYFNKRGVAHAMRKGNEDIGAMADALAEYGPLSIRAGLDSESKGE